MLTKLQAWMRARGDAAGSIFTADTIADKYGVVKGSYTSIALPNSKSYQVSWSLTLSICINKLGCKLGAMHHNSSSKATSQRLHIVDASHMSYVVCHMPYAVCHMLTAQHRAAQAKFFQHISHINCHLCERYR